MHHVMIDLETLGTSPSAPILSIGAVYFDPMTGDTGDTLHLKLDFVEACTDRVIDPATIKWWLEQDKDAQLALLADDKGGPGCTKGSAIDMLEMFLVKDCVVWGNGATFDISMLENLFSHFGQNPPWKFWSVRDVRTIVDVAKGLVSKSDIPFEGVKHDALADAVHQATYVSAMWQALRNK